jgi:hypothetical protein
VTLDVAVRLKNTAKPEAPSVQLLDVYIDRQARKLKKDIEEFNGTVHSINYTARSVVCVRAYVCTSVLWHALSREQTLDRRL